MEPYKFLLLIAALLVALTFPSLTRSYVVYKCRKGNRALPKKKKDFSWNAICIAIVGLCAVVSLFIMDDGSSRGFARAVLCIVFAMFAVFGTTVDSYIRIIGNEMLLIMLPIGILYRIVDGGISSLLGSLIALLVIILTFGLAMLGTKKLKGVIGVGMGDVKLSMVIALTVGFPGVMTFLGGMALAIVAYCVIGLKTHMLLRSSYFPMCGMIMAGLMLTLYLPVLSKVLELL
jgi:leader peptidase (prepilin peptidase)/N-methyltransferase